jgi:hypothetical protein
MLGVAVGGEVEQRADGGEPGVAGSNADAALGFEVVEERPDQRGIEVFEAELVRCPAGAALGERSSRQKASR